MAKKSRPMLGFQTQQLTNTKTVTIRRVLGSSDFVAGFTEARAGKPFDYDRQHKVDCWFYERGRQLALIYNGALKDGRAVTTSAIRAYVAARNAGVII